MLLHLTHSILAFHPVTFIFTNPQIHWHLRPHQHRQDSTLTGKIQGGMLMTRLKDSGTKTPFSLHQPHLSLHQIKMISWTQMVISTKMPSNGITQILENCCSILSSWPFFFYTTTKPCAHGPVLISSFVSLTRPSISYYSAMQLTPSTLQKHVSHWLLY